MKGQQVLAIIIAIVATIGAVYYAVVDKETQGALVVLLGILYVLALPHIVRS